MKTLEQGSKRIQKIGEELKKDILEPAKAEAEKIVEDAKKEAHAIVENAQKAAVHLHKEARLKNEQEANVFQSSLAQAAKQSVEELKQVIENRLFSQELHQLIKKEINEPKTISKLLEAILKALEKEGIEANLTAIIPQTVSQQEVNQLLGAQLLKHLREGGVTLDKLGGGVQVRLNDQNVMIDVSDEVLLDLFSSYRKDFRKVLFGK